MASADGGVEIEEVAAKTPERIHKTPVDPTIGFQPFQARQLAMEIGLDGEMMRPAGSLIAGLYRCFAENDCSLAEVNPLVVTRDGRLLAADAKLNFDDNALYREMEIRVPVVARLVGTNVEEGERLLAEAGLSSLIRAADLGEAARKAVEAAGQPAAA